MRRTAPIVGLLVLAGLALACTGGPAKKEEEPTPPPAPAPTEPPKPTPPETPSARGLAWPLRAMAEVPGGRSVAIPPGHHVVDLDVDPAGHFAVLVTSDTVKTFVWTWDFSGPLRPVTSTNVLEVAFSPFDGTVYIVTQKLPEWSIERGALTPSGSWTSAGTVYSTAGRVSSLVTSLTRWDDEERVFFAREYKAGFSQVIGVRRDGKRVYEVTSPTGNLGQLTDADLRSPPEAWMVPPLPLRAESATPLSIHPVTGALLWRDGLSKTHRRDWSLDEGNWRTDQVVAPKDTWTWSPNGWYAIDWAAGTPGVKLVDPAGGSVDVPGPQFAAPPVSAANGRTLLGWTADSVVTVDVKAPLAPVRFLETAHVPGATREALATEGLAVTDSTQEQIYGAYDELLYGAPERPVFVAIDGMLEVLHAGFEAVFLRVERDVSRPRLATFLDALVSAAGKADERRVREIASLAKRMSNGDYAFPEGEKVLAERVDQSELHGKEIDFGAFHPRGPYAADPKLADYFRAFHYVDALELTREEHDALAGDAALVDAWRGWIAAQGPYLSGSRYAGAFGDWTRTPFAAPGCEPKAVKEHPVRMFPLSWGLDAEILERVTAHDDEAPACGVARRTIPSGLDLMAGLGSPSAAALLKPEMQRYPALADAHRQIRARFPGDVDPATFPGAWLRLLQILGSDGPVPEGVSPDHWHARLLETALASWATFRHTTVLVNEGSAAQMGDGGPEVFERLTTEPARGAVDPVPQAWAQLATLFDTLSGQAKGQPETDKLADVLGEAAGSARRLGDLATKQQRGEALTEDDYTFIGSYAGTVEHPYLLLSAAAANKPDQISAPEPMMRIVDVHTWNDPQGPPSYWHVAVGRPRNVTVLLGDRGVLVPASGAVYSYYEVSAGERIDDAAWRARVDAEPRPAWVNGSMPAP